MTIAARRHSRSLMPTLAEQIIPRRKLMLMASETAIFTLVLLVGTTLTPLSTTSVDLFSAGYWNEQKGLLGLLSCFTIAILCQASLSYNDLYDWKVSQNRAELPNRLLHSAGYSLVMLAMLVFVAGDKLFVFPGLANVAAETWTLIFLLGVGYTAIYAWRAGFHWFFFKWNFGERVAILGTGPQARTMAQLVYDHRMSGFEAVGMIGRPRATEQPADDSPELETPQHQVILGSDDDLAEVCRQNRVARVVVALEERRGTLPVSELLGCRMSGVAIEEREAMFERLAGKIAVESLRPSYLIFGRGFAKHPVTAAIKRIVDIGVSTTGLILTLPLCLIVSIVIKLESKGGIFFKQERVGQDGELFQVIKFRTMAQDAEKDSGPVWAQENDSRVTRIGKILRVTRIDEIPQMLNVLAGKMSFVGPRPERPFFVEDLSKEIPFYPLRLSVKPGLTGWAQVMHPYGASVSDSQDKLQYDLYYIKNMSPLFDINIILRTVGVILFGKGAR